MNESFTFPICSFVACETFIVFSFVRLFCRYFHLYFVRILFLHLKLCTVTYSSEAGRKKTVTSVAQSKCKNGTREDFEEKE